MSSQTNSNSYCLGTFDTFRMIMCRYSTFFRKYHGFISTLCNTTDSTYSHGTPISTTIIWYRIWTLQPLSKTRAITCPEVCPSILKQIIAQRFLTIHQPIRNSYGQDSIIRKPAFVFEEFDIFITCSSKLICRANDVPTYSSNNCVTSLLFHYS